MGVNQDRLYKIKFRDNMLAKINLLLKSFKQSSEFLIIFCACVFSNINFLQSLSNISIIFNSFWVSVPVLSEAITVHDPKASTADKFLTTTFLFDIFSIPIERAMVIVIGNASGIELTARLMDISNISLMVPPLATAITATIATEMQTIMVNTFENAFILIVNGVSMVVF